MNSVICENEHLSNLGTGERLGKILDFFGFFPEIPVKLTLNRDKVFFRMFVKTVFYKNEPVC